MILRGVSILGQGPVTGYEASAGRLATARRPPKGSIPRTCPQRETHPILGRSGLPNAGVQKAWIGGFSRFSGHQSRKMHRLKPRVRIHSEFLLRNQLTFDVDWVMILLTFTNSLGPTKASTAEPILTSGPCFSAIDVQRIFWIRGFSRSCSLPRETG
jgi:hypothetical protein